MIGENIKRRREELGLSQSQLTEKAREFKASVNKGSDISEVRCFDQAQLSRWENNERTPSLENMNLLATILNCNLEDLTDNDMKAGIYQKFYDEAYRIAHNKTIKSNREEIKIQVFKLNNAMHSKNINDIVHLLLETYLICDEKIDEIGEMIPEVLCREMDKKDNEFFMLCMYRFIMGLHNGFLQGERDRKKIKKN